MLFTTHFIQHNHKEFGISFFNKNLPPITYEILQIELRAWNLLSIITANMFR